MEPSELEGILLRLSLDGASRPVCGVNGYPILALSGKVLYARPKTVLVSEGGTRFACRSGIEFAVLEGADVPAKEFFGYPLYGGRSEATLELFLERFGDLFSRNEMKIQVPPDPFEGRLSS